MKLAQKKRKVRKAIAVLIALNLFLFLVKWLPTQISHSLSVKADAFNSLGDFAYAWLILLGFEILLQSRDESHPHGHERFEPFISLTVAGAIGITGILIVKQTIENISNPVYEFTPYFLIVLVLSILAKYWLSKYMERKGNEVNSTALIASSKDSKMDILASSTALVGVLGGWGGIPVIDTILGLAVSGWIFKTSFEIGKKNFGFLTGSAAPQKAIKKIEEILEKREEIIAYHDLVAHYVGPEIHVSLSIHLPKDLDFQEVHKIEDELRKEIGSIKDVDAVYLHLEPSK